MDFTHFFTSCWIESLPASGRENGFSLGMGPARINHCMRRAAVTTHTTSGKTEQLRRFHEQEGKITAGSRGTNSGFRRGQHTRLFSLAIGDKIVNGTIQALQQGVALDGLAGVPDC